MKKFISHTGIVAPIARMNIDTDALIPKQFLKRIERSGFGQYLFFEWRFDTEGREIPDFILNQEPYRKATVLLAQANFGCGSSREHAPWALDDFGFKVIIAPSYADIFYSNCFKNGILPITLPEETVNSLFAKTTAERGYCLTVNLEKKQITDNKGLQLPFDLAEDRRQFLLQGLDEIGQTLKNEAAINAYEAAHITG